MEGMKKVEVLRAACCVAGIDGEAAEAELRILQMLADQVGVGEASLTAMIERAQRDPEFYKEQFRVLKAEPKETMRLLFGVALADGQLKDNELSVLQKLANRLEISQESFDHWLAQARDYTAKQ